LCKGAFVFREFIPKSYLYLRSGYTARIFRKDLIAGLTVGIIALPLAMAFAIASGVPPERGLFTAIIAGFLISALGGSRIQIGGPTGAFVVIIYDIIQRSGYDGLAVSTLLAAVFLILFGLFRLGSWIKYVPYPLVTGFTTAIAVIIFSTQIKDFFGLSMGVPPANFIDKWVVYASVFSTIHFPTFFLGAGTFAVILLVRRFIPKLPWAIAAIVFGTLLAYLLNLPVETIQTKFGQIPNELPVPLFPSFDLPDVKLSMLFMDAMTIAFLASIESLLSAVVGDGMMGGRHKADCELVGLGIANCASILFGGIPATGAIARTATNVKTGAQTPMAGMIHALTLFLIMLFFAPLVSQIPLTCLAAILIMVSWNMSEAGHFISLFKTSVGDIAILLTAFLLTIFVDITVAVTLGMILASFSFMKRMSLLSKTVRLNTVFRDSQEEFPERTDPDAISNKTVPLGVEVYEIEGPFFFGAADMLKDILNNLERPPKVYILRMRYVPFIDASGMHALNEFYLNCAKGNTTLILSGIQGQTKKDLDRYGMSELVGKSYIFAHIDDALAKAKELVSVDV